MSDAPQYTGELRKGDEPGTVVGTIRDIFGWPIEIRGTLDKATGTYVLEGRLGRVPDTLRIEAIDGEAVP